MATTKITDLTAYTDPVNTDVLPIVDVTSDVTKKVSIANVMKNASLGSAAAPGIAFDGDPNTGIYSPGADQVAISTGGSGRLFIDDLGRVGVGAVAVAGVNFNVQGSTPIFRVTGASATNPTFQLSAAGVTSWSQVVDASNSSFYISRDGTERLRITSAGFVGIGSSSPQTLLHLANTTQQRFYCTSTQNAIAFWKDGTPTFAAEVGIGGATGLTSTMKFDIYNGSAWNTAMTIDSSSRVGIGVTPSYKLHVDNGTTTDAAYLGNGYGGLVFGCNSSGERIINTNASGPIVFQRGGTETARIDSSSRLLVGTSTALTNIYEQATSYTPNVQFASASQSYNAGLSLINYSGLGYPATLTLGQSGSNTLNTNALVGSGNCVGSINFVVNDGTNFRSGATVQAFVDASSGSGDVPTRLVFSTTADGASSPTERMRIRNNGTVMIGTTSVPSPGGPTTSTFVASTSANDGSWTGIFQSTGASSNRGVVVSYSGASPNDGFNEPFFFQDSTTPRFYVTSNGGVKNYSANNANLSDRNVKKDITPAAGTWDCIKEWEIVNYRYQDQPDDADLNLGVIAQQVAESCPEVVTVFEKAKDDQPEKLGVKEQQMYWMAIKALQEAQVRIEQLEAKVAALEAA